MYFGSVVDCIELRNKEKQEVMEKVLTFSMGAVIVSRLVHGANQTWVRLAALSESEVRSHRNKKPEIHCSARKSRAYYSLQLLGTFDLKPWHVRMSPFQVWL